MALKKGICKNYGECELAQLDKKKIVVQEADSTNFICRECEQPLHEIKEATSSPIGKYIAIGVGALAVIGGGAYFALSGDSQPKVEGISLSKSVNELVVGANDTLQAIVQPEGISTPLKWASSDPSVLTVTNGIVTAVASGTAKIGVQVIENKELKAFCDYTVKEPTLRPPQNIISVLGGKADYNKDTQIITIKQTVTLDLHTRDNETVTLYAGDQIIAAKVQNGYLKQGEFVINGESRLFTGLNDKLY